MVFSENNSLKYTKSDDLSATAELTTVNSNYADTSAFMFVKTSTTECSVRLVDKSIQKAIIPENALIDGQSYTVTSIAGNGFASATNLEKVRLPKSIKTIGNSAFANCQNLKSITLNSVQSIGTNAFNLCSSLPYLIMPETIMTVAPTILRSCNTQVYVRATEAKTQEGTWASNWNGNNANSNVEYNSSFTPEVEYIEVLNNFRRSNLSSTDVVGYYVDDYQPFMEERQEKVYVYIPPIYDSKPVIGISDGAFTYNTIDYLTIGYAEDPIHLDSYAFNGLIGTSVTINRDIDINVVDWQGNNVLAEYLFADSSVTTILLPNTINNIGPYMFNGCTSLQDVGFITPTQKSSKTEEEDIANHYISTNKIVLPSTVTKICTEAFSSTISISEIDISKSVVDVEDAVFVGWEFPQIISIAYEKESDLPWNETTWQGWNPNWKIGCDAGAIQFSGEFTIDYTLNGGANEGNPEKYSSREEIILADATRTGYTFAGWYLDAAFNSERIFVIEKGSSGDLHFFAKWTPNTYEIVYHGNKPNDASNALSGLMLDSIITYDTNTQLTLNAYSLKGWTFTGWNTEANGSGTMYNDGDSIRNLSTENNAIIPFYAQWRKNVYEVTYHNNKPNVASGVLTGTTIASSHVYDVSNTLSSNGFSLIGWTFKEWNTQADGQGERFTAGQSVKNLTDLDNGAVTLFAQWIPNEYTISYASNKPINASQPLEGSTLKSTHLYDNNGTLTGNGFTLAGWIFNGWNTQSDGYGKAFKDGEIVKNLLSNNQVLTLYAQWIPIKFFIEYKENRPNDASGNIYGTMSVSLHRFDIASELSANGYVLQGWSFREWNTKPNGTGISYADRKTIQNLTAIDGEKITLYACWRPNTYSIYYDSNKPMNASGDLTGQINFTTAIYENSVTLNKNSFKLNGWRFTGWNTKPDGKGNNYSDSQIVKNITTNNEIMLYAQWTPEQYGVVYISNKPSSSSQAMTGSMLNSTFDYDTPSTLRSIGYAMNGYEFVGWALSENGSVIYSDSQMITIGADQESDLILYAIWKTINYTVWATNSDTGSTTKFSTYTVEQERNFVNQTLSGYEWIFSLNYIPKGSTGDKYMNYTCRPITYYINIEYVASGGTVLKGSDRYAVKYDESKTITAPNFNGYRFKHFAHLKDNVPAPPYFPGQEPNVDDLMDIYPNQTTTFVNLTRIKDQEYTIRAVYEVQPEIKPAPTCVAEGTLITLADGSTKAVEDLTGGEQLLVWNLMTGTFDTAPILFIDSDPAKAYEVIFLTFSDGTTVKVISEHGFWDFDLNQYVFLQNDAAKYIGHWFNKQTIDAEGNLTWTKVQLSDVDVKTEITTAWSPVTYGHLCYYVNGMLSMPGATTGLINIFDVEPETMKIDNVAYAEDIAEYGLFTYEEFAIAYDVPEIIFDAFGGQYLKVAIGKGLLTEEMLEDLITRYAKFFDLDGQNDIATI